MTKFIPIKLRDNDPNWLAKVVKHPVMVEAFKTHMIDDMDYKNGVLTVKFVPKESFLNG